MITPNRKTLSLDALLALRSGARAAGRTVVHCHGCFDVVHPGHIAHLQFARSLGDVLVVSVSADAQVNKGADRPLIPQDLRAASLAALECVDAVYVNPDPTAAGLLEALRPDVYVKGREYERNADPRFAAERDLVTRHGGRVVFSGGEVVYSSTALIGRLKSRDARAERRLNDEKVSRFRDRHALGDDELVRLLAAGRGRRVVVVGDAMVDRYHFCLPTGVAGEAPMMSLRAVEQTDYDGAAAVVALHLAGLGADAALVTTIAPDAMGADSAARLAAAGVAVRGVPARRRTICKHRYLADGAKLFKVDEGEPLPPDSRVDEQLAAELLAAADGADAVVFADFGYGTITGGLLDRVLPELRRRVPVLSADVSGRQSNLLRFRQFDLLCPTEREVREVHHDFANGLNAVAWNLLEQTAAKQAIVTLGKQGLVTFDRAGLPEHGRLRSEHLPTLATDCADVLGAGDALLATATFALAAGGSLQAAALLGAMAAAVAVGQVGNEPVTVEQILEQLGWEAGGEGAGGATAGRLAGDAMSSAGDATGRMAATVSARLAS
ncbi:MAG: Bifunctional protein HldE [Phycisphaerales bacterium]|nr:Bifunctional protein HldE [Phycisphaerales bacterium]